MSGWGGSVGPSALHELEVPAVFEALQSHPDGLSSAEALRRRFEFGPNALVRQPRRSGVQRFAAELFHFFAILMWIAAVLCFVVAGIGSDASMVTLGVAIVAVIMINAIFSFWQETKAERSLEALEKLLPKVCPVLRDGRWVQLLVEDLVPGDLIEVTEGMDVPADARLVESRGLRVNCATLTGESIPSLRTAQPCCGVSGLSARNLVFAGTAVVSGSAKALVFASGGGTEFGRIAHLTLNMPQVMTPLQSEIRRVSRTLAGVSCVLGLVFFISSVLMGLDLVVAFLFGIGILVANVPEGLMPTVTLSLAQSAQRMAKRNVLVRRLPAVEGLGATTVICSDKTGTLTWNKLSVKMIAWQGHVIGAQDWISRCGENEVERRLSEAIFRTHSLSTESETVPLEKEAPGDPLEAALIAFAQPVSRHLMPRTPVGEIPFDGDRRRQAVLLADERATILMVKGAPEVLLPLCTDRLLATGQTEPLCQESQEAMEILRLAGELAQGGHKVLAFAERVLPKETSEVDSFEHEQKLVFLGLVALEDPLRPEVAAAVRKVRDAGVRVLMITGDHPETARAIAQQAGIFSAPLAPGQKEARVVLGTELESWSDAQLQLELAVPEIVFARVRADQKLRVVRSLKLKGEIVAVTGDGVNDAPALKSASVGIAMGASGTDVARESADLVLLDDNFASIVSGIEEGRAVFSNVRKFLTYILASNVPEIVPYLFFVVFQVPLPLTVLQILTIDLGTDLLPALGLGAEEPSPGVMDVPPRDAGQRLLDLPLMAHSYLWLGLWEAVAAMTSYFVVLGEAGWTWQSRGSVSTAVAEQATTATFVTIVLMQVVNVFLCRGRRSQRSKAWPHGLLAVGVLVELVICWALTSLPSIQRIFGTQPLPRSVWGVIALFMMGMALAETVRRRLRA